MKKTSYEKVIRLWKGSSQYEEKESSIVTCMFFLWEGSWIDVRREFYYDKGVWTRKNKLYYEKESGLWKRKFLWWEENSFMTKMFFYEKEFQKMEKQLLWWNETSIMTNMFYYEKGVLYWERGSNTEKGGRLWEGTSFGKGRCLMRRMWWKCDCGKEILRWEEIVCFKGKEILAWEDAMVLRK